jgi:hypothetical protein
MKITDLEESANFATLDTEKLFSKLKSYELSRKGRPNHDSSFCSKALITSARGGGHDANPTNTTASFALEFRKERRRSTRGCFECGDTTHFIVDCSKRKKLDSSSNKYDYIK